MAFRSKIDDDIRMLLFKELVDRLTVTDIRLHKAEIRIIHHRRKRRKIARVSQLIQTDNSIIRILIQHMKNEVRADKAGAARYDNRHIV